MLRSLLLLLAVVAVYGQIPEPCFSPPQLSFLAVQYSHERTYFRYFDAEYDFQSSRLAFYERQESGRTPGREYYHIIILHQQNVIYEYNRQTKRCRKSVAGPFRPFGVPPEGRFEGQYYIGGPGQTFEAVEWSDRSDVRRENWLGVFSRINCYPVRTWLRDNRINETVHTDIFNLVQGLNNPALFEPPAACLNAPLQNEPSVLKNSLKSLYGRHL